MVTNGVKAKKTLTRPVDKTQLLKSKTGRVNGGTVTVTTKQRKNPYKGFYYWGLFENTVSVLRYDSLKNLSNVELMEIDLALLNTSMRYECVTISYVDDGIEEYEVLGFGKTLESIILSNDNASSLIKGILDSVEDDIDPSTIKKRAVIMAPIVEGESVYAMVAHSARRLNLSDEVIEDLASYGDEPSTEVKVEVD